MKNKSDKKTLRDNYNQRKLRIQRVAIVIVSVILILTWVLTLVIK